MAYDVKVSVCCLTYNHEKYIRQMLESLVSQKTNFKYEIIIHDDASTDSTASIIKEYQDKYPKLIKPIFQQVNQYSNGGKISSRFLYPIVQGKYTCFCEGDDFWLDNKKLQKQFDVMEKHPECSICTHYVQPINEDGSKINALIPGKTLKTGIVEKDQYAQWLLAEAECTFQTSSYFVKSELIHRLEVHSLEHDDRPGYFCSAPVGDEPLQRFCLYYGKLYFISDTMSCYRINSIGCWNSRDNLDISKKKMHCEKMKAMDKLYDEFTKGRFSKYIEIGYKKRDFNFYLNTKQYKELFSNEYKNIWKSLKVKTKIKIILYSAFPFTEKIIKKIRNLK